MRKVRQVVLGWLLNPVTLICLASVVMSFPLSIAMVALEDYKPPTTLVNGHMVRFHVNTRQEYVSLGPWGSSRIMMHNKKLGRITIVFKAGGMMWLFEPATADEQTLWRYYFGDTAYTQL